jgi:putative DNA primase/helicase
VKPTEIPVLDGVLDFMTGEIRPHEPGDYLERVVPYKYNPSAECPTWHRCLEDWLPGREEEKRAIQLFLGYCLMPHARYKKALMLYGPPHTGKSQVCMVATELVGGTDYTCGILPSKMNDPRACAPIKGAALNVIPDLPKGQLIGDGGFKAMVSAGDTIQIDQKHIAPEQYTPTAKHIFATNNLPAINDPSSGVFERLLILTFDCPISEEKRDPHLEDKIKKEIEGVLAWAVEGARQLYELNGNWPKVKSSVDAIEKYKLDENPVHDFLEESGLVEAIPTGTISIEELTKLFNEYHSGREWTKKAIRQRVEALGYIKVRVGTKRGIKGIRKTGSQLQLVVPGDDES